MIFPFESAGFAECSAAECNAAECNSASETGSALKRTKWNGRQRASARFPSQSPVCNRRRYGRQRCVTFGLPMPPNAIRRLRQEVR